MERIRPCLASVKNKQQNNRKEKHMKFNKWTICIAACAALFLTPAVKAQTPPTETPEQFYTTAADWLTSIDTNKDWQTFDLEVQSGYKQVTGIGAASDLAAQYDFKSRWNAGLDLQFSGIGSPINSVEIQGGYAVIRDGDVKLETNLRVGYTGERACMEVEPAIFLKKMMTKNTYAALGASMPIYTKGKFASTPSFFIEAGFGHLRR